MIISWKKVLLFLITIQLCAYSVQVKSSTYPPDVVHFVYVSDLHYGLSRIFNGKECTSAEVNAFMAKVINSLPVNKLPDDDGVGAGCAIDGIEMIINSGDIANRQDSGIQSAAVSWEQFKSGFVDKITTKTKAGEKTELFLLPGNHDIANAIGYYKPMNPPTDASSMAGIYNMMIHPETPKTAENYNYTTDRINLAVCRFNTCFFFVNIWPGTAEQQWMDSQLKKLPADTPAIIFTHDPPGVVGNHLTKPVNPQHNINNVVKYESLVSDIPASDGSVAEVQNRFVQFVATHPSIKAYFHGHSNHNQFYIYTGTNNNLQLHTFRSDSPMKGRYSSKDQRVLSFIVVSIDSTTMQMTARECFWARNNGQIEWGTSKTINLK